MAMNRMSLAAGLALVGLGGAALAAGSGKTWDFQGDADVTRANALEDNVRPRAATPITSFSNHVSTDRR